MKKFSQLYGKNNMVYNVHSLMHIYQDVITHGSLDDLSCFRFESFLGQMKKLIRKPNHMLVQLVNRLNEQQDILKVKPMKTGLETHRKHNDGPVPSLSQEIIQYRKAVINGVRLDTSIRNRGVKVAGRIGLVRNFFKYMQKTYVVFNAIGKMEPLFKTPISSAKIGYYKLYNLEKDFLIKPIEDIEVKYILVTKPCFTYGVPLLNTTNYLQ